MTARQIFEYALVELNKVQAPSLLLEDYNYFINKAVNQYINKIYNSYEVNQQKSDDLRVLKGTTILPVSIQNDYNLTGLGSGNTSPALMNNNKLFGATYETYLPDDYLHILNCIAEFEVKKQFKCYDAGSTMHFGVKKLTSDMFSQIINNYYMRPSYKNPYFFINNVNISNRRPTEDTQTLPRVDDFVYNTNTLETLFSKYPNPNIVTIDKTNTINDYCGSGSYLYKLFTNSASKKIDLTIDTPNFSGNGISEEYTTPDGYTDTYLTLYCNTNGIKVGSLGVHYFTSVDSGGTPILDSEDYRVFTVLDVTNGTIITSNTHGLSEDGNIQYDPRRVHNVIFYDYNDIHMVGRRNGNNYIPYGLTTKQDGVRYGNNSSVRMEIRYGKDNTLFELKQVYVDYLKAPKFIRLTQDQVDEVEDNTQLIEFPDYVCQEIVNELIKLLMENGSDPRLQTNIPVNQSIAQPQQEQQQKR